MALVDAHLVMGVSERKLSHGQALLVYATLRELKEQGRAKEDVSLETVETSTLLFQSKFSLRSERSIDNESYSGAHWMHAL